MTHDRWRRLEELYHAAVLLDPATRASFLSHACERDPEMLAEVEKMLAEGASRDGLIDRPVWALDADQTRTLAAVGQRLGPYILRSQIGSGGMGSVYLAEDTRLGRNVAIKISNARYNGRFQREAKAIAALNHPNICTIHDVGPDYMVMELLTGQTLKQLIERGGAPIEEVLSIAGQIIAALTEAHARGIVHRDLKPGNIMLTPSGVKVLDFGLAKISSDDDTQLTKTATVMGTPAYMAPEQVEGKPADERSDLFSLGLVFYELAAGRLPFPGACLGSMLSSGNVRVPPPSRFRGELAAAFDALVLKLLARDPAARPQSAEAVRDELMTLRPATRTARLWRAAAAAFVFLAIGAAWWMRGPAGRLGRSVLTAPKNMTFVPVTDQPGQELYPSLAPDGKSLVYASRISGNWDIYYQRVGGKNPVNLTKDSIVDDTQPALSPDGEQIAFRSDRDGGGIFVMGATGENAKRITDFGYDPAWSPDGREIVFALTVANAETRLSAQSQLFVVNVATGQNHPITPQTGNAVQPRWSPHGYRVAYWEQVQGRVDVSTIPAGGGEAVRVTNDASTHWNPVWSPDGAYLYFASDRGGSMNLWRVPIDERSGKVLGEMEPVTTPSTYAAHISFSRTGRQMAYVQRNYSANVYRVGFDPERETAGQPMPVTQGSRRASSPSPSPDGEWIAFHDQMKQDDIFVVRKDGSGLRQLTADPYNDRRPMWSPDGKLIAFHSNRGGKFDIWTIRPDGSGLRQLTFTPQGSVTHPIWSPDGKRLVYSLLNGTPSVIDVDKPWSSQSPQALPPLSDAATWFEASSWSPDERRLAGFQLRADGKFTGVGIYSFETGAYTRISDFGQDPVWLQDSRRVIFSKGIPRDSALYLADTQSRKVHQILSVAPNEVLSTAISADNRWIYFAILVIEADIWLANLS
jgi:Tol biopolymer transport system component